MRLEVVVQLAGLGPDDITVELMLERRLRGYGPADRQRVCFKAEGPAGGDGRQRYALEPEFCGRLEYLIRAYPYQELLTHRFELGLMAWA